MKRQLSRTPSAGFWRFNIDSLRHRLVYFDRGRWLSMWRFYFFVSGYANGFVLFSCFFISTIPKKSLCTLVFLLTFALMTFSYFLRELLWSISLWVRGTFEKCGVL
ncbi:hypothetical protein QBC43DRAFT_126710 [Cladorrhinum sp. PSN259]|nr:hypothetical protein QBC43DRAFT_126710 [Cladorrhinum sp. PSN259]